MIASLLRKRTWLALSDLVETLKHCREQRRLMPLDLQAQVVVETCPHDVPRPAACGLCAGLRWW